MAVSKEQQQSQLDALKEARSSGILTTSYDGKCVTYRSDAELAAQIGWLESQLIGDPTSKNIVIRSHKGW